LKIEQQNTAPHLRGLFLIKILRCAAANKKRGGEEIFCGFAVKKRILRQKFCLFCLVFSGFWGCFWL
jgi:hypothetical protein